MAQFGEDMKAAAGILAAVQRSASQFEGQNTLSSIHDLGMQLGLLDCTLEDYKTGNWKPQTSSLTEVDAIATVEKLLTSCKQVTGSPVTIEI